MPTTSQFLTIGNVYSRPQLRAMFTIQNATLDNSVFWHPPHANTIWIFTTEHQNPIPGQQPHNFYNDQTEQLEWQAQSAGRNNPRIINHIAKKHELIVFYRQFDGQYPQNGLMYLGRFQYVNHQGANPAAFILQRIPGQPPIHRDVTGTLVLSPPQPPAAPRVLQLVPRTPHQAFHSSFTIPQRQAESAQLHRQLAELLYRLLQVNHAGQVYPEARFSDDGTAVDLAVDRGAVPQRTFYEIKANADLRDCLREALGQLLEYALWPPHQQADKLIIVTPHPLDAPSRQYFASLRQHFASVFELNYLQLTTSATMLPTLTF